MKIDFIYLYKTKLFDDAFIMDCRRSYKKNHFVNIYSRGKKINKKRAKTICLITDSHKHHMVKRNKNKLNCTGAQYILLHSYHRLLFSL